MAEIPSPDRDDLPMPPAPDGALPPAPHEPPAPQTTSFSRQMAQLVVIPAVIVIVCMLLAFAFGRLAGAKESIDSHLAKLRQSSGAGRIALGLQDPRYKDRWLAAYNIATMIPHMADDRKEPLNKELIDVLDHYVQPDEQLLTAYLLMAVGQLGQPEGLDVITRYLDAPGSQSRQGAIGALLSWPDPSQARLALPALSNRLTRDDDPLVRAQAAAALGELASPSDEAVLQALHQSVESMGPDAQEVRWNAAVALARLGDAAGSQYVAAVLLDRRTLEGQITSAAQPSGRPITPRELAARQDRVILATLASMAKSVADGVEPQRGPDLARGALPLLKASVVWDKITQLADKDPSPSVRTAAAKLLAVRRSQADS